MGEVKQEGQGYGFFGERVDRRGLDSVGNETGPKRREEAGVVETTFGFFRACLDLGFTDGLGCIVA